MNEIILYEAFDGKRFGFEEECRTYELDLELKELFNEAIPFRMWDNNFNELNCYEPSFYIQEEYENCYYIWIDPACLKVFKDFYYENGYMDTVFTDIVESSDYENCGLWYYDDRDGWVNINTQMESLQEMIDNTVGAKWG